MNADYDSEEEGGGDDYHIVTAHHFRVMMNSSLDYNESINNGTDNSTLAVDDADLSVYLLNQPLQCVCIASIIVLAAAANILVIHNICSNELKLREDVH